MERRSGDVDPELALAARNADRDLRRFLFGASALPADDLEGRVRLAVERAVSAEDVNVTINVVGNDCAVDATGQEAIAGAIGEAVTNSVKHAHATAIVVYVETDDDGQIFATVRDDGTGFDPDAVERGQGLTNSITGRVRAAGGRVEIVSALDAGTEVRVWSR